MKVCSGEIGLGENDWSKPVPKPGPFWVTAPVLCFAKGLVDCRVGPVFIEEVCEDPVGIID